MKERRLLRVIVLMVALLLVSSAAVAAQPSDSRAIECVLDIDYNGAYWFGTVTGPRCSVEGTIRFDAVEDEYFYPGKTMHFVEEFTIWPSDGGEIYGKDWGVWNMTTFKFRAQGWVTDASDEWAHLVGSRYHEIGVTSNPDDGLPITAPDGQMHIAPSNRP
ncbi:MAG: hypothetical protein PVH11_08230 [Anaerolineae bacterium]|jgi:hypothetical protein